jgi:hypothetical protein
MHGSVQKYPQPLIEVKDATLPRINPFKEGAEGNKGVIIQNKASLTLLQAVRLTSLLKIG